MSNYLGELGLILLCLILIIIILPILVGLLLANVLGLTGWGFYSLIIFVGIIFWFIFGFEFLK